MLVVLLVLIVCLLIIIARNHALGMTHFKEKPEGYKRKGGFLNFLRIIFLGFNAYRSKIMRLPSDFGWEYSTYEFYSEGEIKLVGWHVSANDSKGIVLITNWFGGCKSDSLEVSEIFLDLGYDVFLLDLRGHGDSDGMDTALGYDEFRDVLAGIEYIKSEFNPINLIVYGVSLGAVATVRAFAAAEVVGVRAIILEAPFDRLINTIRHRVQAFKLPSVLLADILAIIGGIMLKYNPYRFNPYKYASDINVPVMIIHKDNDPYVSVNEVRNILENLNDKDNSELLIVSDHGHGTIVTSHCKLFQEEVGKFLALAGK